MVELISVGLLTVFVEGWFSDDLMTVVDKLLAELLRELVGLSALRIALIDVVLHVRNQVGIRTVHDRNAARGDLTIDSGEATKDDVIEHEKSVLTNPVPGRVEVAGLESVKRRLNTVDVRVAVLAGDGIQAGLELLRVRLLCVVLDLAGTNVAFEVAHPKFDLLRSEGVLVRLKLEELLAVDDSPSRSPCAARSGAR